MVVKCGEEQMPPHSMSEKLERKYCRVFSSGVDDTSAGFPTATSNPTTGCGEELS